MTLPCNGVPRRREANQRRTYNDQNASQRRQNVGVTLYTFILVRSRGFASRWGHLGSGRRGLVVEVFQHRVSWKR